MQLRPDGCQTEIVFCEVARSHGNSTAHMSNAPSCPYAVSCLAWCLEQPAKYNTITDHADNRTSLLHVATFIARRYSQLLMKCVLTLFDWKFKHTSCRETCNRAW